MHKIKAAHEEEGSILVLLDNGRALILSKNKETKASAVEINPNWPVFSLKGDIKELVETIKRKSNPETIELIQNTKFYQTQLTNWLLANNTFVKEKENFSKEQRIEEVLKKAHKKKLRKGDLESLKDLQNGQDGQSLLDIKDQKGRHLIHHVCVRGFLPLVPNYLITAKALLEKDNDGLEALEYHYLNHGFETIPKEVWEIPEIKGSIDKQAILLSWASRLQGISKIPQNLITPKIATHQIQEDGNTPLHQMARDKTISLLDKEYFTHEMLCTKDKRGKTIYHVLAESEGINLLKHKTLPAEILDLKDNEENTVFYNLLNCGGIKFVEPSYWEGKAKGRGTVKNEKDLICPFPYALNMASKNGEIEYLPKEYLVLEKMIELDQNGLNAYQQAITKGNLHKIPKELMAQPELLTPNKVGISALTSLVKKSINIDEDDLPTQLKKDINYALTFLDKKNILELQTSGKKQSHIKELCKGEIKRRLLKDITQGSKTIDIF